MHKVDIIRRTMTWSLILSLIFFALSTLMNATANYTQTSFQRQWKKRRIKKTVL